MLSTQFKLIACLLFLICSCVKDNNIVTKPSTITYQISFENAIHHEAAIKVSFTNLQPGEFEFRMSRSSPGRYALHEFAKNVYQVKATNSKGDLLQIYRPNPYAWRVKTHDGTVHVSYTLFANRADGTYSQIDETHAHLNIPATFMFAPSLAKNPIKISFKPREDLQWKIATQLKKEADNSYSAPNLQYFMDSPTELSNHDVRSFKIYDDENGSQTINFALHHHGTAIEFDLYSDDVKRIVLQQKEVFGEYPTFDFNEYTFIGCYIPNASGDGMEHRNSTILTTTRSLEEGGAISTVSHEFFHAWNVERIRPKSLEPFNFEKANMSGELWFAEGFTSYYTNLILCRANVTSHKEYINGMSWLFNYVWNSPGLSFFNPIEMSYQAPFVDAATSVDPVNRGNTFISYYAYGSVLGLALDLSLRKEKNLNLDDFMKLVWQRYGKNEVPYTIANLHQTLNTYAGPDFGDSFFKKYIYQSGMPDYKSLFEFVGVQFLQDSKKPYLGVFISNGIIKNEPKIGSPSYLAGLDINDQIISIEEHKVDAHNTVDAILSKFNVGDTLSFKIKRFDVIKTRPLILTKNPDYTITTFEETGIDLTNDKRLKRNDWLNAK